MSVTGSWTDSMGVRGAAAIIGLLTLITGLPVTPAVGSTMQNLYDEAWDQATDTTGHFARGVRFSPTEAFTIEGFGWFGIAGTIANPISYDFRLYDVTNFGTQADELVKVTAELYTSGGNSREGEWHFVYLVNDLLLDPTKDYALTIKPTHNTNNLPGDYYWDIGDESMPADLGLVEVIDGLQSPTTSHWNNRVVQMGLLIPEPASIALVGALSLSLLRRGRRN